MKSTKNKNDEFINHYYNVFKKITMENRKLIKNEIENIANGKVWLGQDAMDLKLIDGTGGIMEAIKAKL